MPDSKPKWTPGPWTYAPIPGYQYVVEIRKAEQIFLCAGAVPPGREEEIKANAQLAAAAPDLYTALVFTVDALDLVRSKATMESRPTEVFRQISIRARAALAKAKRETDAG